MLLLPPPTSAEDPPAALPSGAGLSAKYPGDRGIAKAPRVLLAADFETGTLPEILRQWDEANNKDGKPIALADGGPAETGGKRCLQVTATLGQDNGGSLYKQLPRSVDTAYARFYVKFPKDAEYIHHFVWMGGHNPPTRWPNPRAGTKPAGDDRFSVGIEPWGERGRAERPGNWNFYVYWHEMKVSARNEYWGNGLAPVEPQPCPRERWQCVEFMIKLNGKGKRDGELALWLDGEPAAHFVKGAPRDKWTGMGFRLLEKGGEPFEGFDWRTTEDLKINYFWLEHYVTENAARQNNVEKPNPLNRVWFDDVVVAEEYVGPIRE
ncbi:MAG: hypothetical protein HYY18_14160 [Planctomycetes bacterium]|nr:hypothetical protein [Planctomycetota bacterium]